MTEKYKRLPPPNIKREYERAGATYYFKNNFWHREFTIESLKQFYLNDVLLHEIGHHVDRKNNKSNNQSERFAEWFAGEYGFRNEKTKKSFSKKGIPES